MTASRLAVWEKAALALGIYEIPLQFDKYFFFREEDAVLGSIGGVNFSITTLSLIFLYFSWFASSAVLREPRRWPLVFGVPMLAYMAANALSLLVAGSPTLTLFDLSLLLQAYLLFFYLANRALRAADLRFVLWVVAAIVLTQSVAIIGLAGLGSSAHGAEYHLGPIDLTVGRDGRPEGTLRSPTGAGSILYILTLVVCPLILLERNPWRRGGAVCIVCGGMLAIILTQTRGAIATLILACGVLGWVALRYGWLSRKGAGIALAILALFALPLSAVVTQRILEGGLDSAMSRVHLSAIAWEMIGDEPWFGVGAGNSHRAAQVYASQADFRSEWFYTTHCKYLLVWVETGLLGLLAFLAMLGNGLRQSWCIWCSNSNALSIIGICLLVALGGHALHLWVDVFNSRSQVQTLWLVLALAAIGNRLHQISVSNALRARDDRRDTLCWEAST